MEIKLRRHGDVLIKTYEGFKIPKDTNLDLTEVIHKGNNHTHFLMEKHLVGIKDDKKYLRTTCDTFIDHNEHGKGPIPKGDYFIEIQTEYDHISEESKKVID